MDQLALLASDWLVTAHAVLLSCWIDSVVAVPSNGNLIRSICYTPWICAISAIPCVATPTTGRLHKPLEFLWIKKLKPAALCGVTRGHNTAR